MVDRDCANHRDQSDKSILEKMLDRLIEPFLLGKGVPLPLRISGLPSKKKETYEVFLRACNKTFPDSRQKRKGTVKPHLVLWCRSRH
jgi:hypothetical protein